eukprot:CAMPEP_0194195954 /NCGR_PEP_ID=MMETSP0154-20130528/76407_1 /TAXON_ID=1049557 /ORGANISM="Thalassiothrix antarctica, Strain L6-D1" /LENGTH=724 /DNA_ID=CAMNT_0038920517 /DNA_START=94 /DNA_END=2269 /DNA_ORIENTATION=-
MKAVVAFSSADDWTTMEGITELSKNLLPSPLLPSYNQSVITTTTRHVAIWAASDTASPIGSVVTFETNLTPEEEISKLFGLTIAFSEEDNEHKHKVALPFGIATLSIKGDECKGGKIVTIDLPVSNLVASKNEETKTSEEGNNNEKTSTKNEKLPSSYPTMIAIPSRTITTTKEKTSKDAKTSTNTTKEQGISFQELFQIEPMVYLPLEQQRKEFENAYQMDSKTGEAILRVSMEVYEKGSDLEKIFVSRRLRGDIYETDLLLPNNTNNRGSQIDKLHAARRLHRGNDNNTATAATKGDTSPENNKNNNNTTTTYVKQVINNTATNNSEGSRNKNSHSRNDNSIADATKDGTPSYDDNNNDNDNNSTTKNVKVIDDAVDNNDEQHSEFTARRNDKSDSSNNNNNNNAETKGDASSKSNSNNTAIDAKEKKYNADNDNKEEFPMFTIRRNNNTHNRNHTTTTTATKEKKPPDNNNSINNAKEVIDNVTDYDNGESSTFTTRKNNNSNSSTDDNTAAATKEDTSSDNNNDSSTDNNTTTTTKEDTSSDNNNNSSTDDNTTTTTKEDTSSDNNSNSSTDDNTAMTTKEDTPSDNNSNNTANKVKVIVDIITTNEEFSAFTTRRDKGNDCNSSFHTSQTDENCIYATTDDSLDTDYDTNEESEVNTDFEATSVGSNTSMSEISDDENAGTVYSDTYTTNASITAVPLEEENYTNKKIIFTDPSLKALD